MIRAPLISAAALLVAQALGAQTAPSIQAVRIVQAPTVDGVILGDEAWSSVRHSSTFWQRTPDEGAPSSESTSIYVAYTENTLYVGAVMYDSNSEGIISRGTRRDFSADETDFFQFVLDTYADGQNAFVFGTNPAGLEYDGQYSLQGGRFKHEWDGSWEVGTTVTSDGWSAEFAIPFQTIRYPSGSPQTWGINFQRSIRRRNEQSYWAPIGRQFDLFRLVDAGRLEAIEVPANRNLTLIPYVLGEQRDSTAIDNETNNEVGIDAKYSLSSSMTLDLTLNTDFAQVEADEEQINLDRFNIFFPEKRPFFLENADLFSVGIPEELQFFHSRRIGIDSNGQINPILGGARLTGKAAGLNVGAILMETDETDVPGDRFGIIRVAREYENRSRLGAIFVGREGVGSLADSDDHNVAFAVDGQLGIGRFGSISGFVGRTTTPGADGRDHAFRLAAEYDSDRWTLELAYAEVGEDFKPEVGFVDRDGFRKVNALIFHSYRPKSFLGLLELRPHASYRSFWDFEGFQQTELLHVDNHWEWKNGYELHTGVNFTTEGVTEPFQIFPGVVVSAGTFKHTSLQLVGNTNAGAPVSFRLRTDIGGFFGGDRVSLRPALNFRVGDDFIAEIEWAYNDVELPSGDFKTNVGGMRLSYSFGPRTFVQTLVQYNDRDERWSSNWRFGWLQTANVGLFLVYNEVREIGSSGLDTPDRSFVVKLSRQFNVLD